ncbi:hypothetical protein [Pantanalinema sp. GBBB05]|uniref:hypothetical protein n=1 Tax=Pantanalinema sp. GBBB05 TaxID=2604139 RepID=UPI001D371857|nr:hypothetical protein [Pantanalinema sp. GBBB05]
MSRSRPSPSNRNIPLIATVAAVVAISVLATVLNQSRKANPTADQVSMTVPMISLPYVTDTGTRLSVDGIPQGQITLPPNSDIKQLELTAIVLNANEANPKEVRLKQVLLVVGNFPPNTEFELTDRYQKNFVIPAKVVDRLTIDPFASEHNFSYLFPIQAKAAGASQAIAIEVDDRIMLAHLAIKKAGSTTWLHGDFNRTAMTPAIVRRNYSDTVMRKEQGGARQWFEGK